MSESRRGFWFGIAAYVMWGVFPLYFPLMEPASPWEILCQRIVWSAVAMTVLVVAVRRLPSLRALVLNSKSRWLLVAAAAVITANWGSYIWAVNNDHVVESSLGYFINPLVSVVFGVAILGERLRIWQWIALGIASLAVVVLTVDVGHPPWIALVLAFSFGTYGLLKKFADAGAVESLTFETAVLLPFAVAALVWLAVSEHEVTFVSEGVGHSMLLMSLGIATAVPLLCFGASVTRVKMTTLGLLQYLAPVLQFLIGVGIKHEAMSAGRWAGFALVWVALTILTVDALRRSRHQADAIVEMV